MNNQQHNAFRQNQQPNQPQLANQVNQQNTFKGLPLNYPSSPLHQMENMQFVHNQNPQQFSNKPERQKNALYMSSMQFSHNQNNGGRVENYGVNMKQNIITHGRQQTGSNFDNFQRGQQVNIPDPQVNGWTNKPSQSTNTKNDNIQFQKKPGFVIDQNRKEAEKGDKPKSKKNIEQIQAIKRQLEAINSKMQKLGMQQQDKLKTQVPENVNRNFQKGQIAHSMIVSNNNSLSFNQNIPGKIGNVHQKKPMLSLQETYQKMKNQKVQETQKPSVPSFLSTKQEQTQNVENNKDFFNFAAKDRRVSKEKNQGNIDVNSYKNLKYSMIDQPKQQWQSQQPPQQQSQSQQQSQQQSQFQPQSQLQSQLQQQPYQVQSNQNNYIKTSNEGYSQSINIENFSQASSASNSSNESYKKLDNTKADSQSSQASQYSGAEQVLSPKALFKKKENKPEYFLSSASQQTTLTKVESFENISPFGPQKIKKDDFFIGKKMGKGQFGQVNLVRHKKTGFLCAMKTMQKKQIREQKYEGQIARELSIQFYLSHRNITPLYGYFQDELNVYLLVEFCPDGHLLGVLKKVRRMEEQDVSPIIKQIIQGIDYIHKEKIIHRDIKPQNILFSNGVAKIVDFGWAVYRGLGLRKTASGSPLYYSPEIVMGTQYDEKVDIWDIGMMTYQCLLGKVPFKVYTEMDLNRIATDEVTFLLTWILRHRLKISFQKFFKRSRRIE